MNGKRVSFIIIISIIIGTTIGAVLANKSIVEEEIMYVESTIEEASNTIKKVVITPKVSDTVKDVFNFLTIILSPILIWIGVSIVSKTLNRISERRQLL